MSMNKEYDLDAKGAFFRPSNGKIAVDVENITQRDLRRSSYLLGKIHYDKADFDKASENFLDALNDSSRSEDIFTDLKTLGFLIRIASEKLDDIKAQAYIERAEALVDELTSHLGSLSAEYFYNVGVIKNYKGLFEEARKNYLFACQKAREENEQELFAKCLLALGINSFNARDFDSALDYLQQLNQLLTIINRSYLSGAMYLHFGKIYLELEQYEKAHQYLKDANINLQEKKCWNLYSYIMMWQGTIFKRNGDFNKALLYYKLALEAIDQNTFRRLSTLLNNEIQDVNDSNVDIYLDRTNRKVFEKNLGTIDFKHRFVLLEILFLLAKNVGTYFDKDRLAQSIWKDEYNPLIHDKLIYTSVSRLRKLIEPKNTKNTKRVYIIRGKDGYTFNPDAKIRFHNATKQINDQTIGNVELSSPV